MIKGNAQFVQNVIFDIFKENIMEVGNITKMLLLKVFLT